MFGAISWLPANAEEIPSLLTESLNFRSRDRTDDLIVANHVVIGATTKVVNHLDRSEQRSIGTEWNVISTAELRCLPHRSSELNVKPVCGFMCWCHESRNGTGSKTV